MPNQLIQREEGIRVSEIITDKDNSTSITDAELLIVKTPNRTYKRAQDKSSSDEEDFILPKKFAKEFTTTTDQLTTASPVSGGMGMALLQKMGWRPGEGLGKNKEGTLEPLQLEIKMDKKGLVSQEELGRRPVPPVPVTPTQKSLVGKHPVSLLVEFCSKRRWSAPQFELCFECGPDHRKNFLFKVRVDGVEYKPSVASHNKKQAKAEAATICLQSLGVLPP